MSEAALLTVSDVSVGWHGRPVLREVSFALAAGGSLGIVGPNGSGKTTLLRALLGLSRPLAGTIERGAAWRAGHVPQRDALDPVFRFSAFHVVEMFARVGTASAAGARAAAEDALAAVGMTAARDRAFRDLSGGQKQRVLIARALAVRPTVLVLDEPTSGMDVRAEAELLALVREIRAVRGLAVILVTHSLHVVADEADSVVILHAGRATCGVPAEVLSAASLSRTYGCEVASGMLDGHHVIRAVAPPREAGTS